MSNEKPTFDLDGLQESLQQVLGELSSRAGFLKDIQITHHSLLQQEEKRLGRTLGPDHDRVQWLQVRLGHSLEVAKALEKELEVVRIRAPEVEEKDALLHGRITDDHGRGLTNVNVSLEDEKGQVIRFLGEATTDISGYYALRVDPEKIARMSRIEGQSGYLSVRSKSGKVLHREIEPIKIAEGDRRYLDIALKREGLWPVGRTQPPRKKEEESGGREPPSP